MNPLAVCGGILIGGVALIGCVVLARSLSRRPEPVSYHPRPRFSVYEPAPVPVPVIQPPPPAHGHFMERVYSSIPPFSLN